MDGVNTVNVYCPICAKLDRQKLLFKCTAGSAGTILAFCKGCKTEIKIELGKEPLSR
jgi:hypothetical protein